MKRLAFVSVMVLCAVARPAHAQAAPARTGWQAAVGVGGGAATINCSVCTDGAVNSLTEMLRIGYAVRGDLITSVEYTGWQSSTSNGLSETLTYVNAVAQWYPQVANGFYVKAGLGVSIFGGGTSGSAGDANNSATGLGLIIGAGYDIHLRGHLYITPFVDYLNGSKSAATVNGVKVATSIGSNLLNFGGAISWH